MMALHALRCLFCGHANTGSVVDADGTITVCYNCGGMIRVELNPPDDPDLAGRIECLREPQADNNGQAVRNTSSNPQADSE
jgi:hypothetical protein